MNRIPIKKWQLVKWIHYKARKLLSNLQKQADWPKAWLLWGVSLKNHHSKETILIMRYAILRSNLTRKVSNRQLIRECSPVICCKVTQILPNSTNTPPQLWFLTSENLQIWIQKRSLSANSKLLRQSLLHHRVHSNFWAIFLKLPISKPRLIKLKRSSDMQIHLKFKVLTCNLRLVFRL